MQRCSSRSVTRPAQGETRLLEHDGPRRRPESLAARLHPLADLAAALYRRDKAFFYRDFVVEEVI